MSAAASARRRHLVAVAMTDGAPIFEVAIACEIFGRARPSMPDLGYDFRVCNPPSGRVYASPVFASEAPDTYDTLVRADTVIVPAVRDVHEEAPADLVEAVKAAHAKRRARSLPLLRRLRPSGRGSARRPQGDDPLALRRRTRPPLPGRRRRPQRPVHRQR